MGSRTPGSRNPLTGRLPAPPVLSSAAGPFRGTLARTHGQDGSVRAASCDRRSLHRRRHILAALPPAPWFSAAPANQAQGRWAGEATARAHARAGVQGQLLLVDVSVECPSLIRELAVLGSSHPLSPCRTSSEHKALLLPLPSCFLGEPRGWGAGGWGQGWSRAPPSALEDQGAGIPCGLLSSESGSWGLLS